MTRLLLAALLLAAACTQAAAPLPAAVTPGGSAAEAVAVDRGWMGQFGRRDPALAALLTANPGWGHLRDMALFEAVQAFVASGQPADRIGAARAYLALADLSGALDRLLLEVERAYLGAPGPGDAAAQRARRLVVLLRLGERTAVEAELHAGPPAGFGYTWQLAAARLEAGSSGPNVTPGGEGERLLGQVAGYLWGGPPGPGGHSPYDEGLAAFRAGDLTGGVLTLQLLEFSPDAVGPGPELFLYPLLERAYAGLALEVLAGAEGADVQFLEAEARDHLGEATTAEELYRAAATATLPVTPAALLFSPFTGEEELRAVARVRGGAAVTAAASPLETLAGAHTAAAVAAALESLAGPAAPAELYAARRAAGARRAAEVLWGLGEDQRAVEVLEAAHRKSAGYRADFVNPPGFLVDLARGHERVGEYAPAVAVLFELATQEPAARVAYESLKRLYASHTGGAVPPR